MWPWVRIEINAETCAAVLLKCLDGRSPKRLIPYLKHFYYYDLIQAAELIAALGLHDPEVRDVILKLVGDLKTPVRGLAIRILEKQTITAQDTPYLEPLLTRKTTDLRRGVISLLSRQPDADAIASAERLLSGKKPLQRAAALEILQVLVESDRSRATCQQIAAAYQSAHPESSETDAALLKQILQADATAYTLEDALGLLNPAERTPAITPHVRDIVAFTPATKELIFSLEALVGEHSQTLITVKDWRGDEREEPLGNATHAFRHQLGADPVHNLPLYDVWQNWYTTRPATTRDKDGLEMIRAWWFCAYRYYDMENTPEEMWYEVIRYRTIITDVMIWLVSLHEPPGGVDFMLDLLETRLATLDIATLQAKNEHWRYNTDMEVRLETVRHYRNFSNQWRAAHDTRLFHLLRWWDEPLAGVKRARPQLRDVLLAHEAGSATIADIYDQLLGVPGRGNTYWLVTFNDLRELSSKTPHKLLKEYPYLQAIFEACRARILEIETQRGELPTAASAPAMSLRSVYGIAWYIRILQVLAGDNLARGYAYDSQSRTVVGSHLLRVSLPAEHETLEQFATAVKSAKLTQKQLVETAVYAPQWANYVEYALGWEGLASAVWWIHAHTKDSNWHVDAEIRETWKAQVNERTPLTDQDLIDGAVDVKWFWDVFNLLGAKRWSVLYSAARYSAGGTGHSRAKLFAAAMLGEVTRDELTKRLEKRHQDSLRAIGLIPLPATGHDEEIMTRYQRVQEFVRTSRKFGAQRQASEKRAAAIALENLARTAGYPDPLRLQWAMETEAVADLHAGEVTVIADEVALTLRIDEVGKPQLTIRKAGKVSKALPAKLRKHPPFVELRERKQALDKQHARMRLSLETAMCQADRFLPAELRKLRAHPVLAPLLSQLVFITDDGVMGYPVSTDTGTALQDYNGATHPLADATSARIAHPYDLLQSGTWSNWQRDCFLAERIQPFKQVFRELYVLTEAEKADGTISRRYAGHQVNPRQALALLGARGWVARPEAGVQKMSHRDNLASLVTFLQGFYTPAEVEGLTIEGVVFIRPGKWHPLPLTEIPPLLFSEVMRDMDLVVSVAHRGGVDPEATASTVAMRSRLLQETCALLHIENVKLEGSHALITGKLGKYSVHLGSATVHRQPGGALCIIPVHAQHRGRIFLPFADDDPRTAEVISKVLLLARDEQIKDPTILSQIYAGG